MKKLTILIILFSACSKPQEQKQPLFPIIASSDDTLIVFEGTILSDNGLEVKAELSFKNAAVGLEGDFELNKVIENKEMTSGDISKGKYSISYGLPENEKGLTLDDEIVHSDQKISIDKTLSKDEVELRKKMEKFRQNLATEKIYFRTLGSEKLIQTNKNFKPLNNSKYILYLRSNLFTAEGYVTADSVTSEFFERNTGEKWKLAKLVEYDSIKTTYQKLATEKNEGIYLKALAYSIEDPDSVNTSHKSIVIKSILRMEKSSLKNRID